MFLNAYKLRIANLDGEVPTSNHHRIGSLNHSVQCFQVVRQLRTLDFRNQASIRAGFLEQAASRVHILSGANKRNSNVIGSKAGGRHNILLVFFSKRVGRQATTTLVQPFVVRQRPTDQNQRCNAVIVNRLYFHFDAAIVQHQNVTRFYIVNQLLIVDAHTLLRACFFVH